MYDDALPLTGAGLMLFGSQAVGLPSLVTAAVGLMIAGLLAFRFATRRKRAALRG